MALRVGIVGVGWGSIVHAPAFEAVDGYELVALCSQNRDKVEAAGAKVGVTDLSTDWRSFVRRDDRKENAVPPGPRLLSLFVVGFILSTFSFASSLVKNSGTERNFRTLHYLPRLPSY